ncbi:MAG: translation initiation factor IF-2 [Helicobacter trogontum]|uniref:translation initiation factor IF-2 n=1 Tax=Helicobacter trogontum TaxID=50960 RepID=UPI00242D7D78|nr:translation initiation factor IF-2 [Helicobacter trogontum]MCI5785999.1 translation initiation factor IF-2 [Helicobacter trogontum]
MSKVSIKEIADEAAKNPKDILDKAKELGFKVRNVSSTITTEEAEMLYKHITSVPITEKTKKDSKAKTADKKDDAHIETEIETTAQKNIKKQKATKQDMQVESPTKDETQAIPKVVQPNNIKTKKPIQIIRRGNEDQQKMVEKTPTSNQIKIEHEVEKEQASTTRIETDIKETRQEVQTNAQPEPLESILDTDVKKDAEVPQGIDPSQLRKPRVSSIRVISKNDETQTTNKKKDDSNSNLRSATQILDSLKHVERKEKVKKKKDKNTNKPQQKHSSHIISMERDMGGFGYDDEQDEIMLIDLYEDNTPKESLEEERVKKNELNDKIKVNRYSPWMKEGSIARPSKGKGKKMRNNKGKEQTEAVSSLVLPEEIRVYEFAEKANLELGNVLGKLFLLGVKMLKNDFLDRDTIEILASEYDIDVSIQANVPLVEEEEVVESELEHRPPVVTIMGHVDHGKTSLLDYIRNSRIASSEAGGITQHIGAYMVQKDDKWISFIDTPGHEAFAQMRSRGAQVTDIAIIVIAADDGVKQQSIEALNHAKSANVQIIIAMNKMDKEGANPDKLKAECAELGFTPMDWGGEYEFIPISAKTGEGVDVLLETILIQAEILELKASKQTRAKAIVLEGSQQVGKGSVATIIVQQGVLEIGQSIVADTAYGKVRTLKDDTGKSITRLEPSGVAQITGLSEVPSAGALLQVVENDSIAREMANKRRAYLQQKQFSKSTKVTFDELSSMVAKGQIKSVPVILRADTQGSLEAIKASLESLNNQEVEVNVISFGIGGITQSDLDLANASSNCVVLGFNVRPTNEIKNLAKDLGITIKSYTIIYDLIDDMKALLSGLMSPVIEEEVVGNVSVRETFVVAKLGTIAGCMVLDGKVEKNLSARVLRDGVVLWSGKIASLKRFKDDVKEVSKGYECGIMLDGFNDIAVQDEFEIYKEIEKQRVL